MKRHNPDTIHGAIDVVKTALTAAGAAHAIGKSADLIYKFISADAVPNIHQCIALDIAYEAKTGNPGPVLRAAGLKVEAAKAPPTDPHCLNRNIAALADELGCFSRTTLKAWEDGKITPLERAELLSDLYRLELVAQATRNNIDAHCAPAQPVQAQPLGQFELAWQH